MSHMKRTILIIFAVTMSVTMSVTILSTPVFAAPFLVCNPQEGVTHYRLTGPAWVPSSVPAQPDGSIRMDVAGANVGSNSLTVAACRNDAVWGEQCSEFVPFAFERPSAVALPGGLRLSR